MEQGEVCAGRLADFAFIFDMDAQLEYLGGLAMHEDWSYKFVPAPRPNPVLYNYINYTFQRLSMEDKVAFSADFACFNTGLVTDNQEEIYMLFEINRRAGARQKWFFKSFCKESDSRLTIFPVLPEMVNYFDDASELLFDTRLELRYNIDHIIDDNRRRFPLSYLMKDSQELGLMLRGAIEDARRRAKRNYRTAVPQFFENRIQHLLPLCLQQRNRADLALVVGKTGCVYLARTVLPLDWAYNNARRIARLDNEWLVP